MLCDPTNTKYANSKLEDQLAIQIFDRSKKPIELTELDEKL